MRAGTRTDIAAHVQRAHAVGARVAVDATFAPPPVQQSLALGPSSAPASTHAICPHARTRRRHHTERGREGEGAYVRRLAGVDLVLHSATKYFGGHSDLLAGVLMVRTAAERAALLGERDFMGNVPGNLESWLLLRSLRTLEVRVRAQCAIAARLAAWLEAPENKPYVSRVWHLSRPSHPDHALAQRQMVLYGAMMSIEVGDAPMGGGGGDLRLRGTHAPAHAHSRRPRCPWPASPRR